MHMKSIRLMTLGLTLSLAGVTQAAEPVNVPDLAKASGCFSCHSMTEKVVGPAYASVAQRYAGQKDAVADLVMSIQNGSTGKWGRMAMPSHPSLPAADVKRMAEWILTVKK
jgi:cytochrome c